jgi:RNA polymerase sigma-70 factor (ECF subfamily)
MRDNFANSRKGAMQGFRAGREDVFTEIFREFYPATCYYAFQITNDQAAAQDIAEGAFIKVWKRREIFYEFITLKSYLYTIVRNDSLNWLKAESRRLGLQHAAAAEIHQPESLAWENLIQAEVIRELYTAIEALPPQRRKIFTMLYKDGKSVKQVAKELQLSISTIKDHKKAGLIFLRKYYH